jgi:hypothetical protein
MMNLAAYPVRYPARKIANQNTTLPPGRATGGSVVRCGLLYVRPSVRNPSSRLGRVGSFFPPDCQSRAPLHSEIPVCGMRPVT